MVMLIGASVALNAGNGAIFGLTAEIQRVHHLTTSELGFITGALFASIVVCLLTLSHLADRGHARAMLLIGLVVGTAAVVWFAVAGSLWQLVVSRALSGLAVSLFLAAGRSIVVRLDPPNMGQNLGLLGASEVSGFIIGPLLGSQLFRLGGLSTPFWILAAVTAFAAAFFAIRFPSDMGAVVPEADGDAEEQLTRWQLSGLDLLRDRRVVAAALFGVAMYLPVGVYDSLWAKYLHDLGASRDFIGISLTLWGVPLIVLSGAGGRLVDRIGPRRALAGGLCVMVPVLVLYGALDSYWIVASVAIIEACAQAVTMPGAQAAMAQACPPSRTAAGQGLGALTGLSMAGLIGTAAPAIYQEWGALTLFSGVAAGVAAMSIVALRLSVTPTR